MDDTRAIRVAFTGDSILTRRITGYRDEPTRQLYDLIRDAVDMKLALAIPRAVAQAQ